MTLSFATAHVGQPMTFKAIVFQVELITITLVTKPWSSQVM